MSILASFDKLRSLLFRGSTTSPPAMPDAAEFLSKALTAEPGAVLVVGASGSGKSTLLERLHGRAQGCSVLLTLAQTPLLGWEEAPFHGTFQPADGTHSCGMDLEDVLRIRPVGQFRLDFPCEAMGLRHPRVDAVRKALEAALAQMLRADAGTGAPLSLVVDESRVFLNPDLTTALARQARSVNCSVVLSVQDISDVPEAFVVNTRHHVVLRLADAASLERVGTLTGISTERLWQLSSGHALYKKASTGGIPVELPI